MATKAAVRGIAGLNAFIDPVTAVESLDITVEVIFNTTEGFLQIDTVTARVGLLDLPPAIEQALTAAIILRGAELGLGTLVNSNILMPSLQKGN